MTKLSSDYDLSPSEKLTPEINLEVLGMIEIMVLEDIRKISQGFTL